MDNRPLRTAMRCEEDRIVHSPGIANPRWPLCHEAVARTELGWSTSEIADGELSCCWEVLVAGVDTDRATTCDACRQWVHA